MRFRAVEESTLKLSNGYLGQARDYEADAIGINAATNEIFINFCTEYQNPPRGARIAPRFIQAAFDHMCVIAEALSIDSADNECCPYRDLSMNGFLRNLRWILCDATHSGRRLKTPN